MNVTRIAQDTGGYDPFLLEALSITKPSKNSQTEKGSDGQPTSWQKDILLTAIDKIENNLVVDKTSPLSYTNNPPIESFQEAIKELKMLLNSDFEKYAANAQANLTPADILYLFEEELDFAI